MGTPTAFDPGTLSGGVGVGWKKVADSIEVSGAAVGEVSWSGLSQGTDWIKYGIQMNWKNARVSGENLVLYVNGDETDANYTTHQVRRDETGIFDDARLANIGIINRVELTGDGCDVFAVCGISVDGYFWGCQQSSVNLDFTVGLGGPRVLENRHYMGKDNATIASITSLKLKDTAGNNIGIGSSFQLMELVKE
jgi:hypothetical protein